MLICTLKCSRRRLLRLLIPVLLVLLCLFALRLHSATQTGSVDTNEARIAYLAALGWEVESEPLESLSLTLPDPLAEPYLSYNVLQRSQGFDLMPYCSKTLERFTYAVTNHPSLTDCRADLYVYRGEVVAGDLLRTGENGFIAPLISPQK